MCQCIIYVPVIVPVSVCVMYVHPKFTPFYTKTMVKLEEFDKSAECPIR